MSAPFYDLDNWTLEFSENFTLSSIANSKTLLFSDFFPVNLVKLANPGDVPVMCFLHSLAPRLPREMHKRVEAPPASGIPPKTYKMVYATFPYLFPV